MNTHQLNVGMLIAIAGAAVAIFALNAKPSAPTPEPNRLRPLEVLPSGAALLVTADMKRLQASALGRQLTASGRELPGIGRLTDLCGDDPTVKIERVALAMPKRPPGASAPQFGIAALGSFDQQQLQRCVSRAIVKRGGNPVPTPIGSFISIRDAEQLAGGEIAIRAGGPVLLSEPGYLRQMIDTVDRRRPTAVGDPLHQALRRGVDVNSAVVATWIIDKAWLVEMVGPRLAEQSTLGLIRGAALSMQVAPTFRLHVLLGAASEDDATELLGFVRGLLKEFALPARLALGVDVTTSVNTKLAKSSVDIVLALDSATAASAAERAIDLITNGLPPAADEPIPTPAPSASGRASAAPMPRPKSAPSSAPTGSTRP